MRLFTFLLRKDMPNGHIWRGKQRLVKPVHIRDLQKLRNDFAIEEKNMFYLRHPYLTPAQSHGHACALGKNEQNYLKTVLKKKEFAENVTIEQVFGHLRYKENWD